MPDWTRFTAWPNLATLMGGPTCGDLDLADLGAVGDLDREADVVQCGDQARGAIHLHHDLVRPVIGRRCGG